MTNEELQAHIEALRGPYLAGEIEEVDESDGSVNDPRKSWGGGICLFDAELSYRIKPKSPREVWIWPDRGQCCPHWNGCVIHEAHESPREQASSGGVLFREVLPE